MVVQETDNDNTFVSNPLQSRLYWNASGEPHIDLVTSCMGSDAVTRGVVQCSPGNVVTLSGSHFVNSSRTEVRIWMYGSAFVCQKPTVLSASQLQCVLPFVLESTADDLLPIQIINMAGQRSNWLSAINYLPSVAIPMPASQSSASSTDCGADRARFAITLGVLVPLLVVMMALNAGLLYVQWLVRLKAGHADSNVWAPQRDAEDHSTQLASWVRK